MNSPIRDAFRRCSRKPMIRLSSTFPANPACESATFKIRYPEWKVLNPQRIWNRVDGRIRILSNPMTLQTLIQSLPLKYSTWPLNETLSILLSPTRTPPGACSDDNSNRGVLDTCGRANLIWMPIRVKVKKVWICKEIKIFGYVWTAPFTVVDLTTFFY